MENNQCLATKAIIENKTQVGYMFKEAADFDGDSGWRFFTGDESLDFIDQEDNIEMYSVSDIVKVDPAISDYLDSEVGIELERILESDKFLKVTSN